MLAIFHELFTNQIFNAALFGWIIAQLIKTIINFVIFRERREVHKGKSLKDADVFQDVFASLLWKSGGMPSSHSSMVTGMTTAIAIEEGVSNPAFLASLGFSVIVVKDAISVRQTIGILCKKFNELAQKYNNSVDSIKVVEGHSTSEVFVGIFLGFFVAQCVYLF